MGSVNRSAATVADVPLIKPFCSGFWRASSSANAVPSRKDCEKLRRDKMNNLVATLAEEVPFVRNCPRRLDKTAILRLSASYLKLHHGLKKRRLKEAIFSEGLPAVCSRILQQDMVNGTLLVVTESGEILFVSQNVKDTLGHHQVDIIGHNISAFIHPDDLQVLKSQFLEKLHTVSRASVFTSGKNESEKGLKLEHLETSGQDHFSMYIRFSKASKRSCEFVIPGEYELINVRGYINRPVDCIKEDIADSGLTWMVAVLQPVSSQAIREIDIGMSEFLKNNEWATQHDLDGRMINVDHRGTLNHGYMASELLGLTPYVIIKEEDLTFVARSHQLIMKENEIPSTVFRMKNNFNLNLYVQSRSVIVHDRWTKQPKFIVSVNAKLSETEGKILLEEQRRKLEQLTRQTEQLAITDVKEESSTRSDYRTKEIIPSSGSDSGIESITGTDVVKHETDEMADIFGACADCKSSVQGNSGVSSASGNGKSGCRDLSCSQTGLKVGSCSHNQCYKRKISHLNDRIETPVIANNAKQEFSAPLPPVLKNGVDNASSGTAYGVKRPHEGSDAYSDISDVEADSVSEVTFLQAEKSVVKSKSMVKSKYNFKRAKSELKPVKDSLNQTGFDKNNKLLMDRDLKTQNSCPIMKGLLAKEANDITICSFNFSLEDQLQTERDGKLSVELDHPLLTNFLLSETAKKDLKERYLKFDNGLKRNKHKGTGILDNGHYKLNKKVANGKKNLNVNKKGHKISSQGVVLPSGDSSVKQENYLWKNGKSVEQQCYATSMTPSSTINEYGTRKPQQKSSQNEFSLFSQLQDKPDKLRQPWRQQYSALNTAGNQLNLGWQTGMSHDRNNWRQQLSDKY